MFPRLNPRREVREHRELLAYMYHRASYRYLRLNTSHMLEHALNLYLIETRIDELRRTDRPRPARAPRRSRYDGERQYWQNGGRPCTFLHITPGGQEERIKQEG